MEDKMENDRPQEQKPVCLVTVTTSGYLQWTMTMIHSFLESNSWFTGDIIVVSNDLSDRDQVLFSIFPKLRFQQPSGELVEKVTDLCNEMPGFKNLASMFYSLELFNLTGYRKALFLDSDMLVVRSLEEVFERKEPLGASAESCWYQGMGRRADTYEAVRNCPDPASFIATPVNSGFMIVDGSLMNQENYQQMVNMITPALWQNKKTLHADQLLINLFFLGRITLLDSRYNFRPVNAPQIYQKDRVTLEKASVIHYFRQYKPWNFDQVMLLSTEDIVHLKAFRLWYLLYIKMLKFNHLKNKVRFFRQNNADET
jgi:lipopolysaccharide biosynthesis glycosyltransferase